MFFLQKKTLNYLCQTFFLHRLSLSNLTKFNCENFHYGISPTPLFNWYLPVFPAHGLQPSLVPHRWLCQWSTMSPSLDLHHNMCLLKNGIVIARTTLVGRPLYSLSCSTMVHVCVCVCTIINVLTCDHLSVTLGKILSWFYDNFALNGRLAVWGDQNPRKLRRCE
jgi:hypothetical protein